MLRSYGRIVDLVLNVWLRIDYFQNKFKIPEKRLKRRFLDINGLQKQVMCLFFLFHLILLFASFWSSMRNRWFLCDRNYWSKLSNNLEGQLVIKANFMFHYFYTLNIKKVILYGCMSQYCLGCRAVRMYTQMCSVNRQSFHLVVIFLVEFRRFIVYHGSISRFHFAWWPFNLFLPRKPTRFTYNIRG